MAIKINGQDLLKRYINGQEIVRIYKNGGEVWPETVPPPFTNYLCFTANQSNSTVQLRNVNDNILEISTDKENWSDYTSSTVITLSNIGDKIYFKNKRTSANSENWQFVMTGSISASGDIGSLISRNSTASIPNYAFGTLFYGCTSLTTAPELPATTLGRSCYDSMFEGCTSLTTAPQLPATTLGDQCYKRMFYGCTSLTTAPQLPAMSVPEWCYIEMFKGCTSLIAAPELPATTIGKACYSSMFSGCTSLITPPSILPAQTLPDGVYADEGCYCKMFYGCTSLTTAPQLPATTLGSQCYSGMFGGCTSLTTPPALPATTLANTCYSSMFNGCTSLTSLVKLPALSINSGNYSYMFRGCSLIKLSETRTGEYQTPYRIPSSGTGVGVEHISYMFYGTGGTFTGHPNVNQTYYTSNNVISPLPPIPVGTGTATFLAGQDFNLAVKTLAGDSPTNYSDIDTTIKEIVQTGTVPSGVTTGILSTQNSEKQIIGWFDDGTLYYSTDAATIYLNANAMDMFTNMRELEKIDMRKWDTSRCTNISYMFSYNLKLDELDIAGWDVSNVTNMSYMFYDCQSLLELDLNNWDVSKVKYMNYMFYNCTGLGILDINNWYYGSTAVLEDTEQMFANCSSLTVLNFGDINTSRVKYMSEMFSGCSDLEMIYVKNSFDISSVVSSVNMFYGAVNLVGGNGTIYDANNIGATYARIDDIQTPGYFTGLTNEDYFYFTAVDAGCERQLRLPYGYGSPWAHFEISTDKENWSDYVMVKGDYYDSPYRGPRITLSNVGDKVYVRNKSTSVQSLDGFRFYVQNGLIGAGGDAGYLLCINSTSIVPSRAFYNLFAWCTLLRTPPKLPATTISGYGAYRQMFYGCTSLISAPQLPATKLADSCYYEMFSGCTSLASAPALPAKKLCQACYSGMFSGCTSLVDSPTISATTLADGCCWRMFLNCTSLETLPLLASTTLVEDCYYEMFKGCTSIVLSSFVGGTPYRIPSTGTGIDAQNALYHMFDNTGGDFIGTPEVNVTYYIGNVIIVPVEHILYDFASAGALGNLPTGWTNSSSTQPAVVSASGVSGAPSSHSLIIAPFSFSGYGYVKMVYNFYRDGYYWSNGYTTAFSSSKGGNDSRVEEAFVYIEEQQNSLIIYTHGDESRPGVSFLAGNYTLTEFINLNTGYLSATLTNGTDTWGAYSPGLNLQSMLNNGGIYISIGEHCTISSIDVSLFN